VKIAPGAMVCNECELRGDITIGSMTVIHPRASIIAEAGPIIIGECNIVEEQARIINRLETYILSRVPNMYCNFQSVHGSLNPNIKKCTFIHYATFH
jgi:carbonic anhydrase/acetyltransferase-like protein (isoleucine patch superfamily)